MLVVALAMGLLTAPARAASPPNLTGSWINVAAPSAPAWALQASGDLSSLTVQWHGSAAQGHPTLAGSSFPGPLMLNAAGQYAGRYDIKESGSDFPGNMTVKITNANQISVNLKPDAGGSADITFQRGAASVAAPVSAWCSGAANASCQSDPTPIAPGADALASSADFTPNQQSATVQVQSSDAAATAAEVATPPANASQPLHAADCVTVARLIVIAARALRVDFGVATWQQVNSEAGGPASVQFAYALLACLDVLHQQDAAAAIDARVPCPVGASKIKLTHTSHSGVSFKTVHGRVGPPVIVSCTRSNGKLTIHIKSRSGRKPLRRLLGPRLLIGLYHGQKATAIATARVSFANH